MRDFKKDIETLYEDFKHANSINVDNLIKIISDNKDTTFGSKYGFKDIKSVDDYRKKVPLTDFSYYENGNSYVYDVGYRLATSGTLGKQKKYTVSNLAMRLSAGYNFEMPFYLLNMPTSKGINISVFKDPKKETLLSCALYDYLYKNDYFKLEDYYDHDFLFSDISKNIAYIKSYIALAHKDVAYFDSIFLYDLLITFKYMEKHHVLLLNDIKNRTISVDLSDDEKKLLLKQEFTKERIEEIERIFKEESNESLIKRLFPNLKFVSGVGGGKYEVYDNELKSYIGDTDIFYYIYAQTECTMGVPLKMNEAAYAMMPRTCFYEYRDINTDEVLLPSEIEIGKEYEPIVTTFSGLYRYHSGDKVKIKEFVHEAPVVIVEGRINSIINIAGEKVDDADISLAMNKLKTKYRFNQFAVGVDTRIYPNRYILFIEADYLTNDFANDFDEELKKLAFDYFDLRDRDAINPPVVQTVSTDRFASIQKGQIKPKVVLKSEQVKEWINEE